MNRFALTLAVTLVLSFTTGIHAFHHCGCGLMGHCMGGCGFSLWGFGGCGFHGCGYGTCGSGCGYGYHGCGGCGLGYGGCGGCYRGCGLGYCGCNSGCAAGFSYISAPVYGGYVAMPTASAYLTSRPLHNLPSKTSKIGTNGLPHNSRARTIVVDLRSYDLDVPSIQISNKAAKAGSSLIVRDEPVK